MNGVLQLKDVKPRILFTDLPENVPAIPITNIIENTEYKTKYICTLVNHELIYINGLEFQNNLN